jgi:endonuclease YncB( thermonuclease family)
MNPWRREAQVLTLSQYRRRKHLRLIATGALAFSALFCGGMLATAGRPLVNQALSGTGNLLEGILPGERFTCTVESVTDGDTFRCQQTDASGRQIRVRLSGVAARETDGTCKPGHPCPDASAEAATAQLSGLALGSSLKCRKVGETYGRVAAFCERHDGVDLSCAMVESGTVLKWRRYWGLHSC